MTLLHSTRICSWERRWTTTTGHAILRSTRFRRGIYRLRELLDAEATSTKDKVRRGMSTIVAIVAENISVLREARFLFLFPLFLASGGRSITPREKCSARRVSLGGAFGSSSVGRVRRRWKLRLRMS